MIDLLEIINEELAEEEIPYQFSEWKSTVKYPYFVGSYDENSSYFENNRTEGIFNIDGWSRKSFSELVTVSEKLREMFSDFRCTRNGNAYWIRYNNSMPVPTGVEDLMKITITLYITEWKGESNGT